MSLTRRGLIAGAATTTLMQRAALAQTKGPVLRIGVLNDQSGPYRDDTGPTGVACARQAVQEFTAGRDMVVEVLSADHQNKPDIGAGIAGQWFDRDGVDLVVDVPNSAVALAVSNVGHLKNKVVIACGPGTADLTGPQCTPNTIHWSFDTWMLAHSTGGAMVKTGGDTWFFITADYAFGHAMQRDTANFVKEAGGKVLGNVDTPFPGTTDFSSFLLQAQSTGAKAIGLANAGSDTVNCIKQAAEFGVNKSARLAGLLVFISDIHALGLQNAQGLVLTETFYWDLNDRTRAFTERLLPHTGGARPGMGQAGVYGGVMQYLKAVEKLGVAQAKASGAATVAQMKAMPTDDDAFGPGSIRADGRALHPAYLFQVKSPSESKGPWDYYKLLATTPADEAFRPLKDGHCPLIPA